MDILIKIVFYELSLASTHVEHSQPWQLQEQQKHNYLKV